MVSLSDYLVPSNHRCKFRIDIFKKSVSVNGSTKIINKMCLLKDYHSKFTSKALESSQLLQNNIYSSIPTVVFLVSSFIFLYQHLHRNTTLHTRWKTRIIRVSTTQLSHTFPLNCVDRIWNSTGFTLMPPGFGTSSYRAASAWFPSLRIT